MRTNDLIYLGFLLILVLMIDWFAGTKAAYYFLLLVLAGVLFVRIDSINALLRVNRREENGE